jgi:hypothetical protein
MKRQDPFPIALMIGSVSSGAIAGHPQLLPMKPLAFA